MVRAAQAGEQAAGVFILCDATADGFPIQYVSPGFVDLYGYSSDECVGKRCGDVVGGPAVRADTAGLAQLAKAAGLPLHVAPQAVASLTRHVSQQCSRLLEKKFGFALLLNRKKDGTLFSCECLMLVLRSPEIGFYIIGFQRDVSQEMPPHRLVAQAAAGKLESVMAKHRSSLRSRLAALGLDSNSIGEYLHDTAVGMLQANPQPRSRGAGHQCRSKHRSSHLAQAMRLGQIPEACEEEATVEQLCSGSDCSSSSTGGPGSMRLEAQELPEDGPMYVLLGREPTATHKGKCMVH